MKLQGKLAKVSTFIRDVWVELKRVMWLSPEELVRFVGLVVIVLLVFIVFLGGWDFFLSEILKLFSSR